MSYLRIQKEETLKAKVFARYFDPKRFAYKPNSGNADFGITDILTQAFCYLAEVKRGVAEIFPMITRLLLTYKKTCGSGGQLPPPFIGCFDAVKIAFVPFYDILPIFAETDVNWNAAPSDYLSADFIKLRKKVEKLTESKITVFKFSEEDDAIKDFIGNLSAGNTAAKSRIAKNNFPHIFYRWLKEIKPAINISAEHWRKYKSEGVLDCDFFRADMMSSEGSTLLEKLKIILENDAYKLQRNIEGDLFKLNIDFTDGGAAYTCFWNKYERPSAEEYQRYIIGRRDLLVPQNIREVKGSFFTPKIWVEKSQEYLEKVFGADWQDEYYIWDCAAGTGNLLAGLTNKDNIWASDIDQPNIDAIHALIGEGLNLLHDHVFQFDFLNDILTAEDQKDENEKREKLILPPSTRKLPPSLCEILDDPEKRKKLIVYINPPYAEGDNVRGIGRKGVQESAIHDTYQNALGKARSELFAQFFMRVYREIPGAFLASFSKLKNLQAPNFKNFRNVFLAKLEKLFIVPANTFDNVSGQFPIVFFIWNTYEKERFQSGNADVFGKDGNYLGTKKIYNYDDCRYISDWLEYHSKNIAEEPIGDLSSVGNDFQNQRMLFINDVYQKRKQGGRHTFITKENLIVVSIYFAVRRVIPATWLNDRDQFLYPRDAYKPDTDFQHNCLAYALFNNNISCKRGVNHWIPFTEKEAGAKEKFESNFMNSFLKGKTFSPEARAVLSAGKALWKYYHGNSNAIFANASFYDIREFFQGRKENGTMNAKSADETYNALIKALRDALKILAKKIEPKVYEYGFLEK
ncbi:MAG: hypothetical protein LBG87_09570 [Spirochaetaceae bacterium]|jgi:hypothetical protein|nr:hypothetical protein [Spirochaetaceae bacterium]